MSLCISARSVHRNVEDYLPRSTRMKCTSLLFVLMIVSLSLTGAAQTTSGSNAPASSSPVAYLYVSNVSGTTYEITGYSVDASGTLTSIPGSPFPSSVQYMAVNGKWLFGADDFTYIRSLSIASNGALQEVSSINASSYNQSGSGGPENVFLDHTGASLYDGDINEDGTGDSAYQSFTIDQSTGQLNFQAVTSDASPLLGAPLAFTGANAYSYSSGCDLSGPGIYGYKRNSDGSLTPLNINPKIPAAPNGSNYCPYLAAPDATTHVAISMTPMNGMSLAGPPQLAVYSQNTSGNLMTTSTSSNMPKTLTTIVNDLWMSPTGKLLAVGGSTGLQVFHFNGARPITHYTGLLTSDSIDQLFWDNANHLYAISRRYGSLHVYTVTPTTYSEAPGSPYPTPG